MAIVVDDVAISVYETIKDVALWSASTAVTVATVLVQTLYSAVFGYIHFLNENFEWNKPHKLLVLFIMYFISIVVVLGLVMGPGIRESGQEDYGEVSFGSDLISRSASATGTGIGDITGGSDGVSSETGGASGGTPTTIVPVEVTTTTLPDETQTIINILREDFGNYTFPSTCSNNQQDGDEDGVDCGGGCFPCHCSNNVLDSETEQYTDCGGECLACVCLGDSECDSNLCGVDGVGVDEVCYARCADGGPYPPYLFNSRSVQLAWVCNFGLYTKTDSTEGYWNEYNPIYVPYEG